MKKSSIQLVTTGAVLGLIIGVLFIFVQPLFGMSPLTQRHAEGYMKLSEMSHGTAITSAWLMHLFISACYGIACSVALILSKKIVPYSVQIVFLSWITTVIAPPANALIVKLIGTQSLSSFTNLPAMNFSIDAKLILHLIFFAVIALTLWVSQRPIK